MYDKLAPYYRDIAKAREKYTSAVDQKIVASVAFPVDRVLDLGAGDGVRGVALASRLGARQLVLCDSSAQMVELCKEHKTAEAIQSKAEELPLFSEKFDVILCLWNVLGHVPTPTSRIQALRRMGEELSPQGSIFIDLNNRHNAKAYGRWTVRARRLVDTFWFNSNRGDVSFHWNVAGQSIPGQGHLFTYSEILSLVSAAGLVVTDSVFVDYLNGTLSRDQTEGQMLLRLEKAGRL